MASSLPNLILVRHGETLLNQEPERFRGWKDVPLSPEGRRESQRLSDKLKGIPVSAIFSSDLKRAQDTADLLLEHRTPRPQVFVTDALRPWKLGDLEGQEVNAGTLRTLRQYEENPERPLPNGEPFAAFLYRFIGFFRGLAAAAEQAGSDGALLVVTHTRGIRAALGWLKAGRQDYLVDPSYMTAKKDPLGPAEAVLCTLSPDSCSIHISS